MLAIAFSLLGGWILSLFGFQTVVIAGMLQVFGVTITSLGYYFLFAMLGALRIVASLIGRNNAKTVTVKDLKDDVQKLKETKLGGK